jgi:hypothetical protein
MDAFPHRILTTPVVGTPTPTSLMLLKTEIIANAMAVPSARGGGLHGHLSLIVSTAEYFMLTANYFD